MCRGAKSNNENTLEKSRPCKPPYSREAAALGVRSLYVWYHGAGVLCSSLQFSAGVFVVSSCNNPRSAVAATVRVTSSAIEVAQFR